MRLSTQNGVPHVVEMSDLTLLEYYGTFYLTTVSD